MIKLTTDLSASQKGEIVELKCMAFLMEKGWNVSTPCGNFLKYDVVAEKNNRFYTIQCKKSHPIDGGFYVKTVRDLRVDGKKIKASYNKEDFNYFMTEYEGNFYMFPNTGRKRITFRTSSIKNKTQKLASDYNASDCLDIIGSLQ